MQQLVSKQAVDNALGSLEKKANIDDINRSLTEVGDAAAREAHAWPDARASGPAWSRASSPAPSGLVAATSPSRACPCRACPRRAIAFR